MFRIVLLEALLVVPFPPIWERGYSLWSSTKKEISWALPFCPEDGLPASDAINVVNMLSEQEAVGRNLDKTQLTTANIGSWSDDLRIIPNPIDGE